LGVRRRGGAEQRQGGGGQRGEACTLRYGGLSGLQGGEIARAAGRSSVAAVRGRAGKSSRRLLDSQRFGKAIWEISRHLQ